MDQNPTDALELVRLDALRDLSVPDPSPTLTVLRKMTDNREEFTLKREPMAAPPTPPAPEKVRAGRRAHSIDTLTGLQAYVDHVMGAADKVTPIAFYRNDEVECVLDEESEHEKEIVGCGLVRDPEFSTWEKRFGKPLPHDVFVDFLRIHTSAVGDDVAPELIGTYSSLSGTLVHGADEFLDMQARSATFTVRRKERGKDKDTDVQDVPTQFSIAMKILPDDADPTLFNVQVKMSGSEGAAIVFTLQVENFQDIVDKHIDARLEQFAKDAGFLCVRGKYSECEWNEPRLPSSVVALMEQTTNMIAAMTGNTHA